MSRPFRIAGQLVLLLLLMAWLPASAQYVRHINAYSMLRASAVYHVVGDSKGFLWFCTDHGLARYDGRSADFFTRQQGLADDMIFNIYEDRKGRIWAFSYNGKYSFIDGDSIHNERNDSWLARLPHPGAYVTSMAESGDSLLSFGFLTSSILTVHRNGKMTLEPHEAGSGSVIVGERELRHVKGLSLHILAKDKNYRLCTDDEGLKVYRRDSLIWRLDDPALSHRTVFDLYLNDRQELMASTISGLEIISLRTGKRSRLLADIRASSCYPDVSGNFWITTPDNGVFLLHQEGTRIRQLHRFDGLDWTLINDRQIVFVKAGVLYKLVPRGDSLAEVPVAGGVPAYFTPLYCSEDFSIFFDNWQKGSYLYSRQSGSPRMRRIVNKHPDELLFFKKIQSVGDTDFFVYGGYHAFHLRRFAGSLRIVSVKQLPGKVDASVQDPRSGAVYFSSQGVLYHFDFGLSNAVPVRTAAVLNAVSALRFMDSALLILAEDRQLYTLSPVSPSGKLAPMQLGFPTRDLSSLGLSRLLLFAEGVDYIADAVTGRRGVEPLLYPFSAQEYERIAFSGGKCVMKMDGKYYYFDTTLLNRRRPAGRIYLRKLTINGRDYRSAQIDIRNASRLDMQVSLGILDFSNSVHSIRYRLIGPEDSSWQTTRATELTFVLRKAGAYELQVAPENASVGEPLRLRIQVHAPFFRTTGFFVLCGVVVVLLCGAIVYFVFRYRRRQFIRELDYLRLEHRAINALLNPHFIFNSINNIQGLINRAEKHDAAEYLAVLSRLIRQNLENLQFNLIPLKNELALIERYIRLQNLRFGGTLRLDISLENENLEAVPIPPLLVHTFVENAIIHGYRRKDRPFEIRIDVVMLDEEYLQIVVRDNGIGLNEAARQAQPQQRSSMGISFNRKRLSRLSDFYRLRQRIELRDLSEAGESGTEVVIVLYAGLKSLLERRPPPAR